ncbi:GOGA3-like protein [Mya arenaria]|uniref:GOGA3-like protein n=1 Tax=Mya arenaria TaxID=6604 RepID=A0ABY7E1A0_MYAAR|nr:GOGA3-like protein [Mya arenaria]
MLMEPYDLTVHQLTFNEDQIKEGSLDSFSNVVHYDSALLDQTTGRKPGTHHISSSAQFAYTTLCSAFNLLIATLNLKIESANLHYINGDRNGSGSKSESKVVSLLEQPSPTSSPSSGKLTSHLQPSIPGNSANQKPLSKPRGFLPSPFQVNVSQAQCTLTDTSCRQTDSYASELNQLIKDVYSEVAVTFHPLVERTTIPDWILLQGSRDGQILGRHPAPFLAQPSRVKVTHVYSQSLWSPGAVTPGSEPPSPQEKHQQDKPSSPASRQTAAEIQVLKQVVTNTTASSRAPIQVYRMASGDDRPLAGRAGGPGHKTGRPGEPFESVAEALHLQQSVIGGRRDITPVSADVVAQVVAAAGRKLGLSAPVEHTDGSKIGGENVITPTPDCQISLPATLDTAAFSLPPPPTLPDISTSRELIRIHGMYVHPETHQPVHGRQPGSVQSSGQSNQPLPLHSLNSLSDLLPDDNQSVASSNSELETLNDNATESFLQSLPPFKHVNLLDIMPEPAHRPDVRYSPPVKETSFRPVNFKPSASPKNVENPAQGYTFVTDSGVFSPDMQNITAISGTSLDKKKSFVIPKPGPLFHSTPKKGLENNEKRTYSQVHISTGTGGDQTTQLDEVRREKAKLEGQLEMLNIEAQATLQERAELQAQVASLKLKLMSQKSQKNDAEKDMLKVDVEGLKQLRIMLEGSLSDLQRQLEEKSEEGRSLQEELNQSQDTCDRLNLRMSEVRDEMRAKDMTVQALKSKVAELYVEVQSSIHVKMEADNETRVAKSELLSLQGTKDWYQQQLELATCARSELQKDLTLLQAQASSQSSIIERLKMENAKLRQQFTDIQNKALKEKEILAKHLEAIESDMMDREAAFQEIQRERSFLEDAFSSKIQTAEDEKNRISLLMQMINDLENQLDKAHGDLKKKQNQIVQLENENIEILKKLSLSQEVVVEKETIVEELKQKLIEVEARLKAFQNSIVDKDSELMKLREEKAKTEIALKAALEEKTSVDKVLDSLKLDMGKVESSFKQMRHELNTKSAEVHHAKSTSKMSEEQIEALRTDLEKERRMYEVAKVEFENKTDMINQLKTQKINSESEITVLREKLSAMELTHGEAMKEKQFLDSELSATREKLEEIRAKMEGEKEMKNAGVDNAEYKKVQDECIQLKEKLETIGKDSKKDVLKQKARVAKLSQDLNAVKGELVERQKVFDENMEVLGGKLREVAAERERLDTELTMTHRKYEFSMIEQKDHIDAELQKVAGELQQAHLEKQSMEAEFSEAGRAWEAELARYQERLGQLEHELGTTREELQEAQTHATQDLQLQLEKEKGRLAGLMQSNATLKQHVSQLESALAGRESVLQEMQTALHEAARENEHSLHENLRRVTELEGSLQRERDSHRDVRKQNESLKGDVETLQGDMVQRQQEVGLLQAQLESSRQEVQSQRAEMSAMEGESRAVQRELERLQQLLRDNLAREPVVQEQIKARNRELTAAHEQLSLSEERQVAEINNVRQLLQEKSGEVDSLKTDIAVLRQEKHSQQLTEKLCGLNTGAGDAARLELPPLPFDMGDMDRLLQETTVRALDSKPLDNLQNCLLNLRAEISGLQSQMDVHTSTVQSTNNSWSSIEQQVSELCTVVQTITNTTAHTGTTYSLAAAAVQMADDFYKDVSCGVTYVVESSFTNAIEAGCRITPKDRMHEEHVSAQTWTQLLLENLYVPDTWIFRALLWLRFE